MCLNVGAGGGSVMMDIDLYVSILHLPIRCNLIWNKQVLEMPKNRIHVDWAFIFNIWHSFIATTATHTYIKEQSPKQK